MTLAENIRRRRKALGLSLGQVAYRVNGLGGYLARSTLNNWELGLSEPRVSDLERLAAALRTTPARLAGWENDEHRP